MDLFLYFIAPVLGSLTWEAHVWTKERKSWQKIADDKGISEFQQIINERIDNLVKGMLLGWGAGFILGAFDVNALAERITGVAEFHFTGHGLAYVLSIASNYWFSKIEDNAK